VTVKTAVSEDTDPVTTCHGIFTEAGDEMLARLTLTWKPLPHVPVC
jgi:hypothetical protein